MDATTSTKGIERQEMYSQCLKCGYTEMADYVAARNIAARVAVNQPNSSVGFLESYKPRGFSPG